MKIALWKKITLGFMLAIIGAILITGLIANYMIDTRFDMYLLEAHEKRIEKIKNSIEQIYREKEEFTEIKNELARYALLEDLFIELRDMNNQVIFSSGYGHLRQKRMMGQMMQRNRSAQAENYMEESYPLIEKNNQFGTLYIGYYGQWNLTERDIIFKNTLNDAFKISITAALLFGLIISLILSRQLATPIIKITGISNQMRDGNLGIRSEIRSSTKEIEELSQSINYLAETLQQQEMLRKRLTADMAHEIRTPLTALQTHVEAMMDGIWEPTHERLAGCHDEIHRLTKLVENLQDLAKLEQANLSLNKSRFNLTEELDRIVDTFKAQFINKQLTINIAFQENVIVLMDRDKIRQIMFNLLSNAYKYSREGGTVSVKLEANAETVKIAVLDNGIGIREEDLPHIFERFYRGDLSRNRETGGAGIGLTIVKTLVETHGGKITVESQPHKGSSFQLIFPNPIIKI